MPITGASSSSSSDFAPLDSARLRLRRIEHSDARLIRELAGNWEVARFLAHVPHPYAPGLAEDWIAHSQRSLIAGNEINLAIVRRDDDQLVGVIGIVLEPHGRAGELGYWIGRPYWRQGYAIEAVNLFLGFLFQARRIERVTASTLRHNKPSLAILEKAGLNFESEGERDFPARGGAKPVMIYTMTRRQFEAMPQPAPQPAPQLDTPSAPPVAVPLKTSVAKPVVLVSAVALIDGDGRVLLAQRPVGKTMAGLWEFPGGKIVSGETPEEGLIRELNEELGIDVSGNCLAPFTFASHAYANFHLLMPLFVCRKWEGLVRPQEGQALAWVRPEHLDNYDMPPADEPLVAMLRDYL